MAGEGTSFLLLTRTQGAGGLDVTAPTITSSNAINLAENAALSHTLTANEAVTWTKTGGADAALFTLVGSTLSMTAKDYETPTDADANNTYVVQVTATDAALNATNQTITVTVTDVADSIDNIIIVMAGQSNSSGRATNNQVFTTAGAGAQLYHNDNTLHTLADPVDDATGQVDAVSDDSGAPATGSVWPLVATRILAQNSALPHTYVPCAKGGSSITAWLPGASHVDRTTLYGSMIYRVKQQAGWQTAKIVICWWQGETDAGASMSQGTYAGHLSTITTALATDLPGATFLPCKLQTCTDAATLAGQGAINAAIGAAWGSGNVGTGPDLSTINTDDGSGLHLAGDLRISVAADLWTLALQAALGQTVGLAAVTNLIPKSEQFDAWLLLEAITVTADQASGVVGAASAADRCASTSGSSPKRINSQQFSVVSGQPYDLCVRVKSETAQFIQIYGPSAVWQTSYANFDIIAGTVTQLSACQALCRNLGGGWFELHFMRNANATSSVAQMVISTAVAGTSVRAANGAASKDYLADAAQVNNRRSVGPYAVTA